MRTRPWKVCLVLTLAAMVAASSVRAAESGGAEANQECIDDEKPQELSPELKRVLGKVDDANKALEDVRAGVNYIREIPLLDEKERSRGTLVFKKPGRIALKLGKPRNEAVYTDGKTWWVVDHDAEEVEIYKAAKKDAEEQQTTQEAAFLDFGYGRGFEAMLKDYLVELVATEIVEPEEGQQDAHKQTLYRLKFTPKRNKKRPARYAAIEVVVSDSRWLPHVLVLHESEGEIVHTYQLARIRTNTGVEDEVFEYEPPGGYAVRRPQR